MGDVLGGEQVAALREQVAHACDEYHGNNHWTATQRQVIEYAPFVLDSHEALRAERDAARQRNDQSQQEWLAMRAERDAALWALATLLGHTLPDSVDRFGRPISVVVTVYVDEARTAIEALSPPAAPAPDRQP